MRPMTTNPKIRMPAIIASAMIQVATTSFCTFPIKMEDTVTEWFLQVQYPAVIMTNQKKTLLAIYLFH